MTENYSDCVALFLPQFLSFCCFLTELTITSYNCLDRIISVDVVQFLCLDLLDSQIINNLSRVNKVSHDPKEFE